MAEPNDPTETATKTQERIWEKQVDEFVKHSSNCAEEVKMLYSMVWARECIDIMHQKIKALDTFDDMSNACLQWIVIVEGH